MLSNSFLDSQKPRVCPHCQKYTLAMQAPEICQDANVRLKQWRERILNLLDYFWGAFSLSQHLRFRSRIDLHQILPLAVSRLDSFQMIRATSSDGGQLKQINHYSGAGGSCSSIFYKNFNKCLKVWKPHIFGPFSCFLLTFALLIASSNVALTGVKWLPATGQDHSWRYT